MHRQPLTLLLLPGAFCIFSQIPVVFSSAVNRSIDDSLGDSITGQRPTFLPSTGFWDDQTCLRCWIQPPISSAFDGTYTAATYLPGQETISISFDFTGTAIYVFFILANQPVPGATATTAANFTLDGSIAGTFTHSPTHNNPAFQFNDPVFSKTGLENVSHQMVISASAISNQIWVNFDYALYTFEEAVAVTTSSAPSSSPSPSSASGSSAHVGAIVGGVVSGLVALGALVAFFFFCRRGCHQQHHVRRSGNINNNNGAADGSMVQGDVAPFMLPAPSSQQKQNVDDRRTKLRQMRQRELERQMRLINEEIEDLRNGAAEHADADRMTDTDAWAQGLSDEPPPYCPRAAGATAGEALIPFP